MSSQDKSICFEWKGDKSSCPETVTIPDGVEVISSAAFRDCKRLVHIELPEGVTTIERMAFEDCENLVSVKLPDSVKVIERYAFAGCKSLANINIPKLVEKIGADVFKGCDELNIGLVCNSDNSVCFGWKKGGSTCPESIVIPEGVKTIHERAFDDCYNLKEVVFPSSLKNIEESAFRYCANLVSIQLPDSLEKISYYAFSKCKRLERVSFGAELTKIADNAFENCKLLSDVVFPSKLKSIGEECFRGCESLTKIKLLDVIDSVGKCAFADCINLAEVETDGLKYAPLFMDVFENTAFVNNARKNKQMLIVDNTVVDGRCCAGEVVVPEGILQIGAGAFFNCKGLTRIIIPESVEVIDYSAFEGCAHLDEVKFPSKLKFCIAENIFKDCVSLKSIELPANFGVVYGGAFENTPWLQAQKIDGQPVVLGSTLYDGSCCKGSLCIEGVTHIAGNAFYGNNLLTEVLIEDGVESIGTAAFKKCRFLKRVALPSSVKTIGSHCFADCHYLERMEIPEGVRIIRNGVFENCSALQEVKLPPTIEGVWKYAFSYCPNLSKPVLPDGIFVSVNAFYDMEDSSHVPACLTAETNMIEVVDEDDRCCHHRGLGVPKEAYYNREDLIEVIVPDGVKIIGKEAFKMCRNLKKVVLPDSVEVIGVGAFAGTDIEELVFPKNLKYIYDYAFKESSLKHVVLPDGLLNIGREAFYGTKIEDLDFPKSLRYIKSSAFEGCNLKRAVLPEGLLHIGYEAFKSSALCQVYVPSTVTYLGDGAFSECVFLTEATVMACPKNEFDELFAKCIRLKSLRCNMLISKNDLEGTLLWDMADSEDGDFLIVAGCLMEVKKPMPQEVVIPEGVLTIASGAFKEQKEIVKVRLPHSLLFIGNEAFRGCAKLEEINIPQSLKSAGLRVFSGCGFVRFDWPEGILMPECAFENCKELKEVTLPASLKTIPPYTFDGCKINTLTVLNDEFQWSDKIIYNSLKTVDYILWRGDVSNIDKRIDQIRMLNAYTKGLEFGFDYGEVCQRRNDELIESMLRGIPVIVRLLMQLCFMILLVVNIILHIVFYPYIWVKEMAHMCNPNHYSSSYFFDKALFWLYGKLHEPTLMDNASDSMIRYLRKKNLR